MNGINLKMNAIFKQDRRKFLALISAYTLVTNQMAHSNELRKSTLDNESVSRAVLSMLASGRAYGKKLQKLMLNGLQLELWDLRKKVVYFSLPQDVQPSNKVFATVTKNPELRKEAKLIAGNLDIDGMHLTRTKEKYNLYAINYQDIFFDPDRIISIDFGRERYSASLGKLALFLRNDSIYGGRLRVTKVPPEITRPEFLNHGALVTPQGESTLLEFVQEIIDGANSVQEKIQMLLNFVTEKILYDQKEFYFGKEFLQRFTETLIAKEGDCSNKSILFASMLEQLEIEYILVYSKNHIFVAVEQDNFQNSNSYEFAFRNKKWTPAETTAPGFRIGQTKVTKPELLREMKYVQIPSQKNELFSYPDEKLIMFN
jgi:hypothetical protein